MFACDRFSKSFTYKDLFRLLTKRIALSSTLIFDYPERYFDVLYEGGLHGRIFMKINAIFNTHMLR